MSEYTKFYLKYYFKPDYAIKISSGQGKYGLIDNSYYVRHDSKGQEVYNIPGTTVKGRVRASYNRYMNLFVNGKKYENNIFGNEGKKGWARFSDLEIDKEKIVVDIHTGTTIDRFRRTVKEKQLRVDEYVELQEDGKFIGEITGYYYNNGQSSFPDELAYLILAVLNTTYFGGDKSSGFGKGVIFLQKLKYGEIELLGKNIKKYLKEHLEKEGE